MPVYDLECSNCGHCFEEYYYTTEEPSKTCPECNQETAQRVICSATKGVVVLYGKELIAKLQADGKKIAADAARDPKLYANLVGESTYENMQKSIDKRKRDR